VEQVRLGEVFLEGNRVTRRDVLLREAGLDGKSGEPLDPILLGKGITRLRRSGLYDSVELQYIGLDGTSDRAHVRLSVAERPAFTVDVSLGFSTERLMSLRTEVRHRNVLGTMLDASWLLDFGLFVGRFSQTRALVRWPRILGSDVSATFTPIAVSYVDEPAGVRLNVPSTAAGQKASAAWEAPDLRRRLFSVGGSLGLDWRLHDVAPIVDDKLSLGIALELRLDWLNTAAPPYSPFSEEALQTVDGLLTAIQDDPTRVATVTPRVAYNNIDNPFDPHEGFGAELFFRGSPPLLVEHGPFGVLGVGARGYTTLFNRLTLAGGLRARLGFAGDVTCDGVDCRWALMQNDLLLLGGERSVRGVTENLIGVLGPSFNQQLQPVFNDDGTPLTQVRPGLYGAALNLEARFSLFRFLIGEVRPAVFLDAGLSSDDFDLNFNPVATDAADGRYAWSAGAGIRWVFPVGPLSVDFAYSPPRNTYSGYLLFGYVF
jgi:outer membrane protein assembly factor BamA